MDAETTQPCQQQILTSENAEHQTTTPVHPTMEPKHLEDQNAETETLFHSYSCYKLSFLIKMAFLQNIKTLGSSLSEVDVIRQEESMEEARTQALKVYEQIRDRGFSYDVEGFEYLKSCTLH